VTATKVPDSQPAPLTEQANLVARRLRPAFDVADPTTRHAARMQALNLLLLGVKP
jgi:hypothetical protein